MAVAAARGQVGIWVGKDHCRRSLLSSGVVVCVGCGMNARQQRTTATLFEGRFKVRALLILVGVNVEKHTSQIEGG